MKVQFKYGCVVILYNPERDFPKQLERYAKSMDCVYLYDNSIQRNEWIEKKAADYDNVEYIFNDHNDGISCVLNKAYVRSLADHCDFLLTMDQDTEFSTEGMLYMKQQIEQDHELDCTAIYAANFVKRYVGAQGTEYSESVCPKGIVSEPKFHITSGNFLNLKLLDRVFPLDDYFIAFVDFDLDYEIALLGYKLKVFGDCIIVQQIGEPIKANTLSKHGLTNLSVNRYYYLMRNNLHFKRKFKAHKDAVKFARKKRMIYYAKLVLSEKKKLQKIGAMLEGFKDYREGIMGARK
ncbi:hypothetical protein ACTNA4_07635 [Bariatricus sp. HCP28S3_A7]|uniref:hypothetical protein n=1 Tax=Bariatricus sp. HCP28S3_A7 TaxID=3438894 RepID=UPI003F8AB9B3